MHTTTIGTLLQEFNDDQLLAIKADRYERERLQAEKEELASTTATAEALPENATHELHIDELKTEERQGQDKEQESVPEQEAEPEQETGPEQEKDSTKENILQDQEAPQ